jgi:uncharacterized protein (TIGR00255 family)
MKSMTGYGRAKACIHERTITAEIKSVNHRYLDCSIKSPKIYGFLEEAVKKQISKDISRGKVDVYISIDFTENSDVKILLNKAVADNYMQLFSEMENHYQLKNDVTVMNLAKMPDVFTTEREEADTEEITADVTQVLQEAISHFNTMRKIEGEKMREDILNRRQTILKWVEQIEERAPKRVQEYQARLEAKMQEILSDTNIDPQRILTEAAIFADKAAVDEETVRLRSHLDQLEEMANSQVPVGRKMDFLIQEMNREANTIGSKANDFELSKIVVELKAEIEKIREQVQNIE